MSPRFCARPLHLLATCCQKEQPSSCIAKTKPVLLGNHSSPSEWTILSESISEMTAFDYQGTHGQPFLQRGLRSYSGPVASVSGQQRQLTWAPHGPHPNVPCTEPRATL